MIQEHLDKVLPVLYRRMLSIVPYRRWLKLPADRAVDRSVAAIKATIRDDVAEGRQRLHDDPGRVAAPQNLLEAMIVAADEPDSGLDDAHVIGNVLNMPLAGAGPRVCPGRYLAILEMKVAMATLLASCDIDSVDTPDGGPARDRMALSLQAVGQSPRLRDRG